MIDMVKSTLLINFEPNIAKTAKMENEYTQEGNAGYVRVLLKHTVHVIIYVMFMMSCFLPPYCTH